MTEHYKRRFEKAFYTLTGFFLNMEYDLELKRVVNIINKNNAKIVCIQLADGLKPQASYIQRAINNKTKAQVLIWAGSCFGACDIPTQLKNKVDLLIQFGHSEWK